MKKLFDYIETELLFENFDPPLTTKFIGSTIRGAFGINFKRVFCPFKKKACSSCLVREKCLYFQVFETPAPQNDYFKTDFLPHPFLFSPVQSSFEEAPQLRINFFLFGKFIEYFPYFIVVFEKMAQAGFTGRKSRPGTVSVYQDKKLIYSSQNKEKIDKPATKTLYLETPPASISRLKVEFLTPVRIKSGGKDPVFPIEFELFMRNVFRRLSLLSFFFADNRLDFDFKAMLEKARKVKLKEAYSTDASVRRLSLRKGRKVEIPGRRGWLIFEGQIAPFYPWIKAAEKFHIGKNTSFGFGKYRAEILEI